MKLAFCLYHYFPFGGLQRDFLRIARTCVERGHEVHVFTTAWEGAAEPQFQLHIIKPIGRQNHRKLDSYVLAINQAMAKEHFDLLIGFNKMPGLDLYYAADVCYQTRIREQRGWIHRLLPRYHQLKAFEEAVFAEGKSTQILLISAKQQPEFVRYYRTEPDRFHLLPPGIAKDRLAPANAHDIRERVRKEHHIPSDHFLLLMVGSGFKTKGVDRSMTAFASLPATLQQRCHLFVIGKDNPSPFLTLAKRLGVSERIQFLGGRSDVPDFLLAADLLLQPSYHENTGTAILEALTSGLPVLTVDACGYAHYVNEANAGSVLPSPFQQKEFNATLLAMLNSNQHNVWRENAKTFSMHADIFSLPERAVDLIERIGEQKKNPALDEIKSFSFDEMMALRGECFRHREGRLTQRIHYGNKTYFIKQHSGVGWKEIFKNIFQLRLPILSAKNEWLAIEKLQSIGISVPKIVAYGKRGLNPARLKSFILMEEVQDTISLEDMGKIWQTNPPSFVFKRKLIEEVARIARTLHEHGINHRDFYTCHFLLDIAKGMEHIDVNHLKISLIDLHRTSIRRETPERWIIKDLAGLYFSSKDMRLTMRDRYRFMQIYRSKSLRDMVMQEKIFWQRIKKRGEQLYRDLTT